jgi:hypothetical protein
MATFKKREQKVIKIPMFKILKNQFSRMDKFFEIGTVNFKIQFNRVHLIFYSVKCTYIFLSMINVNFNMQNA